MNVKELNELRRRFKPEKTAISRIYGCYVNSAREIVAYLDEPLGTMGQEEQEKYLGLLKKALSGGLGKNLMDVVFTTRQVQDSDEHRLLSALRDSGLKDGEVRESFYRKVMDCLDMGDSGYLILLACDSYDVPRKDSSGESEEVFTYVISALCPVKPTKPELSFFPGDNEFRLQAPGYVAGNPELGFLFPAFDDRRANIYNALYYSRNPDAIHQEFIDGVFHAEPPMSAAEQRETFRTVLTEALGEGCSLDVIQVVYDRFRSLLAEHKENKNPEVLTVSPESVAQVLGECQVEEEKVNTFLALCGERFGENVPLQPGNLIDEGKFTISTETVSVALDAEQSYLAEARVIDGKKCLLIPMGDQAEVNGFQVRL